MLMTSPDVIRWGLIGAGSVCEVKPQALNKVVRARTIPPQVAPGATTEHLHMHTRQGHGGSNTGPAVA